MAHSSRTRLAACAIVASTLFLGACIEDDGGSGGPPGGFVRLSHLDYFGSDYNSASAVFYASVSTSGTPVPNSMIPDVSKDTCNEPKLPDTNPPPPPEITYLDVGPSLMLTTTGGTPAELYESGQGIYQASSVFPEFGRKYNVELPGNGTSVEPQTWSAALKMPSRLSMVAIQEELSLSASAGQEITWQSTGADAIAFTFQGQIEGKVGTCVASDDGKFTFPAAFASALDGSGTVTATAMSESRKSLNGRSVILLGDSSVYGSYSVTGGGGGPTPTPTPSGSLTNCYVLWVSESGANYDLYVLDLPAASWTSGTKTYGSSVIGQFAKDYDPSTGAIADFGTATSGTFNLTASGTSIGSSVGFDDATGQSYAGDAGEIATGGTGSFTGELSDPDGSVVPGSGTISITYNGSTLSIGTLTSYAGCYDANAFAAMTPLQRALQQLGKAPF